MAEREEYGVIIPEIKTMDLAEIRPRHAAIARRLAMGQTPKQISEELGISSARISQLMRTSPFIKYLRKLEAQAEGDVMVQLGEAAVAAAEVLERTMYTSRDEKLKLKAAESILDRTGHGAIAKQDIRVQKVDVANMREMEMAVLLRERFERMVDEAKEEARLQEEANTIEIVVEEEYPDPTEDYIVED